MSLLVVGSVAFDSIKTPFGEVEQALGGSATYFATSASYYTDVQMVAVIGDDFPQEAIDDLKGRGVDLEGLVQVPGKTFRWKGEYGLDLNNAKTLDTQLNVFEHFEPDLPEHYRDAEYVFLGNIHPALQLKVLEQIRAPKFIGADTMNLWIDTEPELLRQVLAKIDMLFVNDTEARSLADHPNVVKAAERLKAMGPTPVMIKRGEYGALLFDKDETFFAPAYPLESVFDPTGAGDSFGGGFMGFVARKGNLEPHTLCQATVIGSVMASYCVERFSLERLRQLGPHLIEERYRQFQKLTDFAPLEPLSHGL